MENYLVTSVNSNKKDYKEKISEFSITPYLEKICDTLENSQSHFLIITAETGAGKSTVLPLALLNHFEGKMIMTQPRRLAVLGVANRIAELESEENNEVGYKIHLESNITKTTRLEVVTEAILVRQLQEDPALEDYKLVIIDEFHERSVNIDLALAFLKEAMLLRDDLYVVIMSATMDTKRLQSYLSDDLSEGKETPILSIPGRQFPVKMIYEAEKSLLSAVFQAMSPKFSDGGNILVFLPGISDIRKAYEELMESGEFEKESDWEICLLHSSISLEEQKKVLSKGKKRVILSSAIAETSLTVPGITVVIDSGLSRVNRLDLNTGMSKLCTETESEFSATQRAGRAGRLGPGTCIRLWAQTDPRIKDFPPEILRADLLPLVLECSERGIYSQQGIDWLDSPSPAAWRTSSSLLQDLGMISSEGRITPRGRAALTLGLDLRLAAIALDSACENGKINEEGRRLLVKYSSYSRSAPELQKRFIADLERRLLRGNWKEDLTSGSRKSDKELPLILSGYPDRIAKRLSAAGMEPAEYQFAIGKNALLYSPNAPQWLVAPDLLTRSGQAIIFEFEAVNNEKMAEFVEKNAKIRQICRFTDGKIQKTEEKRYGEILLSSKKIPASAEDFSNAWLNEIKEKGIKCLPISKKTEDFLLRAAFLLQEKKLSITINSLEEYLQEKAEEWLPPFLSGISNLTEEIVYNALYWFLNGNEIDTLAPEKITLENGRNVRVFYENQAEIRPVIEIIIQRIFGCTKTPVICGKKVLLRLLSPASRPLQVTDNLEGFWTGAWPEICKEMKGRYPKHNWNPQIMSE